VSDGWVSATTAIREVDDRREFATEIGRAARLAALGRCAPTLKALRWTGEAIGDHELGLFVRIARRRWSRRFVWCALCRCGWKARQGYPIRSHAVSHWHSHATRSPHSSAHREMQVEEV
jgi:hypothetical protein